MSALLAAAALSGPTGAAAWVTTAAGVLSLVPAGLRWLRVAQREHYLAGAGARFGARWWTASPGNVALGLAGVAGTALCIAFPLAGLLTAVVVVVGPRGLSVRGRTGPLVATARLRRLAAAWLVLQGGIVLAGALVGRPAPLAVGGALAAPLLVDAACALTAPVERRLGERYVRAAAARLARVRPVVVGITGSYGKTSTKNHVAHLLAGTRRVVATPASFNNRAGLARAVNEHLAEGTEIFVAEMGTYAKGEIAELCRWCPPEVAVLTAIGPVHLERFGSEDHILEAKAEITASAGVVVVNADDARLAALGARLGEEGKEVVRCSAVDTAADVCVRRCGEEVEVFVAGRRLPGCVALRMTAQPTNVACALAVALRLGASEEGVLARLAGLPDVPNRLVSARAPSGVLVLDDTFNANPAGAAAALAALAGTAAPGRRVVVTPGMVELGRRQADENRRFARAAADVATDLVIVGRTNRRALAEGAGPLRQLAVATREEAVAWVRANLGPGDAVLYENDLPDHYP